MISHRRNLWLLCLFSVLFRKQAAAHDPASFGKFHGLDHLLRPETSHNIFKSLKARGGVQPSSNASRNYWSTAPSQPKSFQQSQKNAQSQPHVTVTDVTDELRADERIAAKEEIDSFLTRESRNTFIARVYGILTIQLISVACSIFVFATYPVLSYWVLRKGKIVPWITLFISSTTLFTMSISERARRSSPLKWQLLSLFTVAESVLIGFITSFYKTKTILSAMMSTAVATMSVTMYTILNRDSKRDLSQWGAGLSSIGMIFLFYGFIQLLSAYGILPPGFLPYNEIVYCLFGASLFALYLAYHTRLIVSGKHSKYQLSEKDYVFGALLLYNDIITIFLYMLRLLDDED